MREIDLNIKIKELQNSELSRQEHQLIDLAKDATYRSYAPYSHFRVGAAILLDNGEIVCGSNQENAAFPSGTCAERTASFYAHSNYPQQKFRAIAIAARGTDGVFLDNPISPCGACRQVLLEYEKLAGEPVKVYLVADSKVFVIDSVKDLLPLAFADFA